VIKSTAAKRGSTLFQGKANIAAQGSRPGKAFMLAMSGPRDLSTNPKYMEGFGE
jgi:hypothetical protein